MLGNSLVEVDTTGTYLVDFSVTAVEPNQFSLFVNGSPANGGTYGSAASSQQNSGQVILNLVQGQTLQVINSGSSSAVELQNNAGGTETNVDASIVIEQVG